MLAHIIYELKVSMKTKDIPIVVLGLGILYIAYLFQNKLIRIPEGFQGTMPMNTPTAPGQVSPAMPEPAMPAMPQPMPPPMPQQMPDQPMPSPVPEQPVPLMPAQPTLPISGKPSSPPLNQAQIQALSNQVKEVVQISQKVDAISKQLQQMSQVMPSAEGFQSYQNPYNMRSPSVSQAYEFRLGKKNLTDEVLGFMGK